MARHLLILLLITSCFETLKAQPVYTTRNEPLYTPRNVKEAYKKGTRSPDGSPGNNYWQNRGHYTITVTAAPPDRTIRGTEKITYINNSPDTLKVIVIRLTPNIHKPTSIRLNNEEPDYLTTGVTIDKYAENGTPKTWRASDRDGTWKNVRLTQPLAPHDSLQLDFDWHYTISLKSNREGMIDSTTYFLAYFYPRVAVYDDYNGWDRMDFTDVMEFYNDFNDYTLNVSVPKNYIVWATGDLQNPTEVLESSYARKFAATLKNDAIVRIAGPAEISQGKVTAQKAVNTWTWKANDISDVTVGLSDHFAWDASSVVVDKTSGRRASVQSAYNDTAKDFHRMVEFGRHALDWLSNNWPGVPYPFSKTTVFQGYADMEYPMMVNDNTTDDPIFSRFVVEHEIAHSWFPFYMGINESRYAFMDEGWATTLELLIGRADLGKEKAESAYKEFRINYYTYDLSDAEDLPIITPADALKGGLGYGNNAYGKASLGYLAMKDMLGDDLFKKCLLAYMDRWHGKHPIPWDFFYSFNAIAGQDLNWFWNNWFFTNNYLDIAIDKVEGDKVSIRNIGGFVMPFDLVIRYSDGASESLHQTPAVWSKDQKNTTIGLTPAAGKTIQSLEVNGGIFVDSDPSNNKWTAK
jgi:hypothetical protein